MENMKFEYKSSIDKKSKIMTGFVFLLFASVIGAGFFIEISVQEIVTILQ